MERLPSHAGSQVSRCAAGLRVGSNVSRVSRSPGTGMGPTKMGGAGAPDDIDKAHRTQAWLATSDQPARQFGRYFFHQRFRDRIRLRWMSSGGTCCSAWYRKFQVQLPASRMLANRFVGCAKRDCANSGSMTGSGSCCSWEQTEVDAPHGSREDTVLCSMTPPKLKSLNSVERLNTVLQNRFRFGTLSPIGRWIPISATPNRRDCSGRFRMRKRSVYNAITILDRGGVALLRRLSKGFGSRAC
jgi:hypothetical protein